MAQEKCRTEQSGYQFKKYHQCKKCPVNHLCTSRTAGRELTEANMPMPWKKQQTLSGKSAIVPNSADKRTYIWHYKDNGVTITLI
jgi:hypothetical protein